MGMQVDNAGHQRQPFRADHAPRRRRFRTEPGDASVGDPEIAPDRRAAAAIMDFRVLN